MPTDCNYRMVPSDDSSVDNAGDNQEENTPQIANTSEVISTSAAVINADDSPPPYDPVGAQVVLPADINEECPPMYADIVKLPTYNESQNIPETNADEDEEDQSNPSIFLYWLRHNNNEFQSVDEQSLGTDVGFLFFFLLAFIFNWIGFFIAYCFTSSYSSHYGAISGFGLSLVKWAFIMNKKGYIDVNPWVLYLFVLLGWVIFLRGMFSYIQLKRYVYLNRRSVEHNEEFMG